MGQLKERAELDAIPVLAWFSFQTGTIGFLQLLNSTIRNNIASKMKMAFRILWWRASLAAFGSGSGCSPLAAVSFSSSMVPIM